MATIVEIEKYKKCNISVHIKAIFTILVSGHVLEHDRSNGVVTLRFQGHLITKKDKHIYTESS